MALKRAVCFLRLQRDLNSLLLAFKPAVCQASNPLKPSKDCFGAPDPARQGTKATSAAFYWRCLPFARLQTVQNPPKAFLAPLTPQANAPRPHQQLFLAFKATPIACYWRSSLPFARLQTLQNPPNINSFFFAFKPTSIACHWRSSLPFATLQTLQNPPEALFPPLTLHAKAPRPHQQLFLAFQGDINSFLLAFKPAVCQASNRQKPREPSKGFFGTLTPQAKAPRPHQQRFLGLQHDINSFLLAFQACRLPGFKPSKTLQKLFWHAWPCAQGTKATSTAFSWPSRQHH